MMSFISFFTFFLFASSVTSTLNSKISVRKQPKFIVTKSATNVEPAIEGDCASAYSLFSTLDSKGKKVLTYYGLMLAGAMARSVSATAVHPLTVIKTMLQTREGKLPEFEWRTLSRGAGSQLIMSIPHGALSFAVVESTKAQLAKLTHNCTVSRIVPRKFLDPSLDLLSSALSTFICSVVSTPQMVLVDRIMAGVYSHFFSALIAIYKTEGIAGFYMGWFAALCQKIPSYALTWMFFQQLKAAFRAIMDRAGTTVENTLIGSLAAVGACCVMIPVDTIKTRIVTQRPGTERVYSGMLDCFNKIIRDEGIGTFYRALPPRLMSVVPMIGIQFGVYELMKRLLMGSPPPRREKLERLKLARMQVQQQAQQAVSDAHAMAKELLLGTVWGMR